MKNIKLEDDIDVVKIWVDIFLNVDSCEEFEMLSFSVHWAHCPLCLEDRDYDGSIEHKPKELLFN